MLNFRADNPFYVHNVASFLPQLTGNKKTVLERFEERLGEPITANVTQNRNHRSVTESLDKLVCPMHHYGPIMQFIHETDGVNATYGVCNDGFCNEILCEGDYTKQAQTPGFSDNYAPIATYSFNDLTTFTDNSSRAAHRVKVSYETLNESSVVEFDIQRLSHPKLINFISADNDESVGSVVIGTNDSNNDSIKGNVWLPIGSNVLIQFQLESYESKAVWNKLNLAIPGAVGITSSRDSLLEQYWRMLNQTNHRIDGEKNCEKMICNYLRATDGSEFATQTNIKTHPCVAIYTNERNWQRCMQSSQMVIHLKTNTNDATIRVNDTTLHTPPSLFGFDTTTVPQLDTTISNSDILSDFQIPFDLIPPPPFTVESLYASFSPLNPSDNMPILSDTLQSMANNGYSSMPNDQPVSVQSVLGSLPNFNPSGNNPILSDTLQSMSNDHGSVDHTASSSNNDQEDTEIPQNQGTMDEPPHKRRRIG